MATKLTRAVGVGFLLVAVLTAPFVTNSYMVYLLTQAFLYAVLAISLDLVWGYTGILNLGHSLWFGTGALVVGMMTTDVSSTGLVTGVHGGAFTYLIAIALGTLIAGGIAAAVAVYSFASRGSTHFYIAIVTLALATAVQTSYTQFPTITGGENGLFGFALAGISELAWYYVAALVMIVILIGAIVLVRSDFGLLMRAIRDQEHRARYLGYDVNFVKVMIFALGAALAGFAGALYATMFGLVSAPLFGFLFATDILIWVAIGGRGTIIGPAIGAVLVSIIGPQLNQHFPFQWPLLIGALFVAVVVLMPDGLLAPMGKFLDKLLGGKLKPLERNLVSPSRAHPRLGGEGTVIEMLDVQFAYGALKVLRGVDLSAQRGELLCIVGPNGAGKSTLLNILTDGRLEHTGSLDLNLSQKIKHRGASPHKLVRAGLGRKFQTPTLFPTLTVAETMILGTKCGKLPSPLRRTLNVEVPRSVLKICEVAGLENHLNRPAKELAHGLKQGLELATAVASRPDVLLLDEPTAGLTEHERALIGEILLGLVRNVGVTIILIEHDLDFVMRIADRIAVLNDGQIIEYGPPDVVANSAVVREAYLGVSS
jgi:branched-chain amino acid transport system permease protein